MSCEVFFFTKNIMLSFAIMKQNCFMVVNDVVMIKWDISLWSLDQKVIFVWLHTTWPVFINFGVVNPFRDKRVSTAPNLIQTCLSRRYVLHIVKEPYFELWVFPYTEIKKPMIYFQWFLPLNCFLPWILSSLIFQYLLKSILSNRFLW